MTLDDLRFLRSATGQGLLDEAATLPNDVLLRQTRLRKSYPPEAVRAATTLLELRERAKTKFTSADDMFFDRQGLEQASGDVIATHRAQRYRPYHSVADLCCGIGGDTLALSGIANVTAVDISPARTAITRANAHTLGQSVQTVCADVTNWIPDIDAAFLDPDRRATGRRVFRLADYVPRIDIGPVETVENLGIKVAPGVSHKEIPPGYEAEFISVNGECREAVLWRGALRSDADIRATVLPSGESLIGVDVDPAAVTDVKAYIYEPDRAVIRAHLVNQLAADLDATKLSTDVAYLTSETRSETTFAKAFEVRDVVPFSIKRLQGYVSQHGIGTLDIKKRRFPMEPYAVRKQLKLKGSSRLTCILTRVETGPLAIFCAPSLGEVQSTTLSES